MIACIASRQTQAGVLPVCDKFSSQAFGYTAHNSMRRKRASQLLAYDHSPQAHGLARSQRNVRRALAVVSPRGATVHIPLADCFSKCRCAAGAYMQVAG